MKPRGRGDGFVLSSGRTFYANQTILGLAPDDDTLYNGYDGFVGASRARETTRRKCSRPRPARILGSMDAAVSSNALIEAAVTAAVSQLGVHEQGGNNAGPEVDLYLASVGLDPGSSWCAAFVYWCFRRAASVTNAANPCPRTAGALKLWRLADTHFRVTAPARGRVFVMDHGQGLGHVGFVEAVRLDGSIDSVEGNTNAAGSRNGDRVARHTWDPRAGARGALVGYLDFGAPLPLVV